MLKLIRRELAQEMQKQINDKRLRGFTIKQIIEQFTLLGAQKTKVIKGDSIKALFSLCGQQLNAYEQRILLKKS